MWFVSMMLASCFLLIIYLVVLRHTRKHFDASSSVGSGCAICKPTTMQRAPRCRGSYRIRGCCSKKWSGEGDAQPLGRACANQKRHSGKCCLTWGSGLTGYIGLGLGDFLQTTAVTGSTSFSRLWGEGGKSGARFQAFCPPDLLHVIGCCRDTGGVWLGLPDACLKTSPIGKAVGRFRIPTFRAVVSAWQSGGKSELSNRREAANAAHRVHRWLSTHMPRTLANASLVRSCALSSHNASRRAAQRLTVTPESRIWGTVAARLLHVTHAERSEARSVMFTVHLNSNLPS